MRNLVTNHEQNPFFLFNVDDIICKYNLWKEVLPRVQPHYAVKCNNSDTVLRLLASLGCGFDCATKYEIQQVLSLGVDPSKVVYAHTTKMPTFIKYANQNNVDLITFDNEEELYKMKRIHPHARAIIRIKYDGPAMCKFGVKFGCDPYTETSELLKIAAQINVNVVGVSFHIGTGSTEPSVFYNAIKTAHDVFQQAANLHFNFNLLDIGGGFPGNRDFSLLPFSKSINMALEEFFPDSSIRIIAEPGTFFVKSAFTLACSVHSVRKNCFSKNDVGERSLYDYYITDGVFGNMSDAILYNADFIPIPLDAPTNKKQYLSTVWGPTCDPLDKIKENIYLPKLNIGDWLVFENMGSYTRVLATQFHGFGLTPIYSFITEKKWFVIKDNVPFDKYNLEETYESRHKLEDSLICIKRRAEIDYYKHLD
ncbi:hypothetical protein FQA39_LY09450 [Lamprigera yunnana]|nr:hypothetical protein FQA39_LY09450 [Lamprigera yunnana]